MSNVIDLLTYRPLQRPGFVMRPPEDGHRCEKVRTRGGVCTRPSWRWFLLPPRDGAPGCRVQLCRFHATDAERTLDATDITLDVLCEAKACPHHEDIQAPYPRPMPAFGRSARP
jgi:hypothetical protein